MNALKIKVSNDSIVKTTAVVTKFAVAFASIHAADRMVHFQEMNSGNRVVLGIVTVLVASEIGDRAAKLVGNFVANHIEVVAS